MVGHEPARAAGRSRPVPRACARWAALTLSALLAGCAHLTPPPAGPAVNRVAQHRQHAEAVTALTQWRARGRLAVQRADTGFSADLDWRQAPQSFVLRVMAPLNGGTFSLIGGSAGVSVTTPKGVTDTAGDADELMRRHLGWSVPLGGVGFWLRGVPDPHQEATQEQLDADGRWTAFAQAGWRISILEYHVEDGLALPARLFLRQGDLQVRMVIKQWEHR